MITEMEFEEVYHIMKTSFPPIEKRNYAGQRALCTNPFYRIINKKNDHGQVIAFMAVWEFPAFCFVEHLAVDETIRGGGIGKALLVEYIQQYKGPIFLEVEPPTTPLARRRIEFYKRLGLSFNDFAYDQLPLNVGDDCFPLNIMSYPSPISEVDFIPFKKVIYKEVYGQDPLSTDKQ